MYWLIDRHKDFAYCVTELFLNPQRKKKKHERRNNNNKMNKRKQEQNKDSWVTDTQGIDTRKNCVA